MATQENPIRRVAKQYRQAGQVAVDRVRDALDNGADWVDSGRAPVQVLTDKTLKLNRISHNSAARLVRVQSEFIEGSVEGAAQRLQAAARARDLRQLLDSQVKLMPATRDRIVTDARKTIDVLVDTRDDLTSLVRETLGDLRGRDVVADAAGAVAQTADKVASQARKTARRKPAASKVRRSPTTRKTSSTTARKQATRRRKKTTAKK